MAGVQINADEYLKHCIGRIFNRDAVPVGVGFLVSRREVVTCSHVIIKALEISSDSAKPSEPISIDFPLLSSQKGTLTGRVVKWYNSLGDNNSDIAVIRLSQTLPQRCYKAILVSSQSLLNHTFLSFGFPEGYSDGVWAQGRILAKHAGNWIQVESTQLTGHQIQPGFSGSPVWDESLRGVVGMVVAAEINSETRGAYIIPSDVLGQRIDVHVIRVDSSHKVPLGRLEVEDLILQRRAIKLGFNLSFLTRLQMQIPSGDDEERMSLIATYVNYCKDHSDFLDIQWRRLQPAASDASTVATTYAEESRRLAEQIEFRNGKKMAKSFELAFKVGMAPEYLDRLQPWQQSDLMREYAKLLSESELPADSLDEMRLSLKSKPDRDQLSHAVFQFEDRIISPLDKQLLNSQWMRDIFYSIWEFGSYVAMTAIGYDAGLNVEGLRETATQAQFYADEIDVVIPSLPKKTEKMPKTEFTAIILHYLLHDVGEGLSGILEQRYDPSALAYFDLAIKSHLLLLLYSPGEDLTDTIYSVIRDRADECKLPEEVYLSLLNCIETASPFESVKYEVFTFQERVREYLR